MSFFNSNLYFAASPIGWSSLFHIIQGMAYGLHYLHNQNLIHLDLKPSNILLDSDMNPRITNIGMATVLGQGRDVRTIAGTL
jgi:serine/threonine protein kinase